MTSLGRRRRLTRPRPLRTVRETFASHGSNLSKASPFRADSQFDRTRRIIRHNVIFSDNLAILCRGRPDCAPLGNSLGCTKRQVSLIHCNSQFEAVHKLFSPFQTRPTWAYPTHYMPAFASSVIPMLLLLACLAVGLSTTNVAQAHSFSMFCIQHRRI